MFDRLGALVSRRWIWILFGWIALAVLANRLSPNWWSVAKDGDLAYLPDAMSSVQGAKLLAAAFPHVKAKSDIILVVARSDGLLRDADYAVADRLVEDIVQEEYSERWWREPDSRHTQSSDGCCRREAHQSARSQGSGIAHRAAIAQ